MKRIKLTCSKCTREISKSNFTKHYDRCDGTFFTGPNHPLKNKSNKTSEEIKKIRQDNAKKAREKLIGKPNIRRGVLEYTDEEIFCLGSKGPIKKYYLTKVKYQCAICSISEWDNKPITLELDHCNGNNKDNRFENLRLLCPNCHSQTTTYKNKNGNGTRKVSDEMIISALSSSENIRQVLLHVGLQDQGANYKRVYKIIEKYNLASLYPLATNQLKG